MLQVLLLEFHFAANKFSTNERPEFKVEIIVIVP